MNADCLPCRATLLANVSAAVAASPRLSIETMQHTSDAATDQTQEASAYTASMEIVSYTAASTNTQNAPHEPLKLLISFGEHAREFISSEVGLRFLKLLSSPQLLAQQAVGHLSAAELSHLQLLLGCCIAMRVRTEPSVDVTCYQQLPLPLASSCTTTCTCAATVSRRIASCNNGAGIA